MNKFISHEAIELERERSSRFVKITLGVLALAALALGLLVTGFVGILPDTAGPIAIAFLYMAIAATAVLYIWDRIFKLGS
jgi:hypothetical protein